MAFTALTTLAYKSPGTVVWGNSVKGNDDYIITGTLKAWASFDGTSAGPTNIVAHNVASITRNSTGNYLVTFTTSLTGSNYCVVGVGTSDEATGVTPLCGAPNALTSGSFQIEYDALNDAPADGQNLFFQVVGIL